MSEYRHIVSFTDAGPHETFCPADSMSWEEVRDQAKRMLRRGVRSVVIVFIGARGVVQESILTPDGAQTGVGEGNRYLNALKLAACEFGRVLKAGQSTEFDIGGVFVKVTRGSDGKLVAEVPQPAPYFNGSGTPCDNGSGTPCDNADGPCSCGATHGPDDVNYEKIKASAAWSAR